MINKEKDSLDEASTNFAYKNRNLPKVVLTKNKSGHYEVEGFIYQYQKVKDIHYFKCEWRRRKEGNCDAVLATKEFKPSDFKEGDTIEVFLIKNHSEQCPTVIASPQNPIHKKKNSLIIQKLSKKLRLL